MIQVLDLEDELDRSSGIHSSRFIVVRITSSLEEEEEEEEMPLERKKGSSLCELLARRSKGSVSKDALGFQLPPPPLSHPPPLLSTFVPANLKKRKKNEEVVEEGELVPYNEGVPLKVPKIANGKGKAFSADSKEAEHVAEVCPQNPTWNPRLELDEATIPWNSTIMEFQRGNAHYLANTLEQPFLLSKDMAALKNLKQQDLFFSLKRDLALISL